jgi:hypothetical protein
MFERFDSEWTARTPSSPEAIAAAGERRVALVGGDDDPTVARPRDRGGDRVGRRDCGGRVARLVGPQEQ